MSSPLDRLVGSWVEAWALCRSSSPWTRDGSAWVVDVVGSVHRSRETFVVEPDETQLSARVAEVAHRPGSWLTVFTADSFAPAPAAGVAVPVSGERLMTTALSAPAPTRRPVELSVDGDRATASVVIDGERAAEGTVGVVGSVIGGVVGGVAVFDRIRTFDTFRRRGLGTDVMAALTVWALDRGATEGVLAASPEGQLLYARLGWAAGAHLVTIVGVD